MELLNKTRVPVKYSTDRLSHLDVNSMNSTINTNVDGINYLLKNLCNINMEVDDYSRIFSLEEAIKIVPRTRKSLGLSIKFKEDINTFVEYIFNGESIEDEIWDNPTNWTTINSPEEIDGGEW